jgi:HK97 family phage portal protein
MKILGLPVPLPRRSAVASSSQVLTGQVLDAEKSLNQVPSSRGGSAGWTTIFSTVLESFAGAWQRNVEVRADDVLLYPAVFACMTLIASDVAKMRVKLVAKKGEIWVEASNPAYDPVLRKPNHFQNRIQFYESWMLSKLSRGNTVVLKERDERRVVVGLYILDWALVRPLISDSGEVFYELNADKLSGVNTTVVVPATEIIHDRFNCLYHPLVGLSPIVACGLAATQGLYIQRSSAKFYQNGGMPPGILSAPKHIGDETAQRLRATWEANYTGDNAKKVAVLGDGLKFERMSLTAVEGQLIEQLRWTVEVVCSTYHVPPYKIGIGQQPAFSNPQPLNVEYYAQCLQVHVESIELCLDEGLGLAKEGTQQLGVEMDTDNLLRMDSVTQMEVLDKGKSVFTPNEARAKVNMPPTPGGNVVYRQQQDFSLEALAKRDAQEDPFSTGGAKPPPAAAPAAAAPANDDNLDPEEIRAEANYWLQRELRAAGGGLYTRRYNPNQPRDPGGEDGGQWVSAGGGGADGEIPSEEFNATDYAREHNDPDATPESVLADFAPDTAEKMRKTEAEVAALRPTDEIYKINGQYTAERKAIHDQILFEGVTRPVMDEETGELVDKHFPGLLSAERVAAATPPAGQDPTFTILGGRGGSGKSALAGVVYDPKTAIVIDSDAVKRMLPEYEGWNAAQLHEESSDIFDRATHLAKARGLNIVHDATMKSPAKAVRLVEDFKAAGYRVEAHYMFLPRQEAAKRAVERYLGKTKRLVPPRVVLANTQNEAAFDKVRVHADKWSFRDNNVPKGKKPRLISAG